MVQLTWPCSSHLCRFFLPCPHSTGNLARAGYWSKPSHISQKCIHCFTGHPHILYIEASGFGIVWKRRCLPNLHLPACLLLTPWVKGVSHLSRMLTILIFYNWPIYEGTYLSSGAVYSRIYDISRYSEEGMLWSQF